MVKQLQQQAHVVLRELRNEKRENECSDDDAPVSCGALAVTSMSSRTAAVIIRASNDDVVVVAASRETPKDVAGLFPLSLPPPPPPPPASPQQQLQQQQLELTRQRFIFDAVSMRRCPLPSRLPRCSTLYCLSSAVVVVDSPPLDFDVRFY